MQACKTPEGRLVIQIGAMPKDTNANGDIFGGWLVSHMDMGAGIEARRIAQSRAVTVAINDLTFIHPVQVGDTVACYAKVIKIGHTSMTLKIEAYVYPFNQLQATKVAEGSFIFVAIDDHGKPQAVKRDNLINRSNAR